MPRKDKEDTTGVMRLPQQHVREGRGTAGYKSVDGDARVEVYATKQPESFAKSEIVSDATLEVDVPGNTPGDAFTTGERRGGAVQAATSGRTADGEEGNIGNDPKPTRSGGTTTKK